MVNYGGNLDSVEKCQFKGIWKNGKTTTIRVPINLAEKILDYARKLDQGELEEEKILGGTKNEIT